MNELMTVKAAAALIGSGAPLALAGTENALDKLPEGNWIAGTIPYFMLPGGGAQVDDDHVFVTTLAELGKVSFAHYGTADLPDITSRTPTNGCAFAIVPAGSSAHAAFASGATDHPDAFLKPTVGWISGVHLNDLARATPKVYSGHGKFADGAVVAHVDLPEGKLADVTIVNLFEPDDGDVMRFDTGGFAVKTVTVGGRRLPFADYVRGRGRAGGDLPLVGDYAGARINVSLKCIDDDGTVQLYAPVFSGIDYRFARPVADYAGAFRARLGAEAKDDVVFSCNCILNYLFGQLEGQAIGGVAGPVTFGEIGYQLLNQTVVMLRVH